MDAIVNEVVDRVMHKIYEDSPEFVIVGISNRHVHLSDEDFQTLFGYAEPKVKKYVRQRGEYAAEDSRTDCIALGVNAPMCQSGHLENAAPIEIEGPAGRVSKEHAAIVAGRHIHMGPDDAAAAGVKDQDMVSVEFPGERAARLDNLLIRVKDSYLAELHLDTDEGNAVSARTGDYVRIVKK